MSDKNCSVIYFHLWNVQSMSTPRADACTGHTDMRATLQRKRWPTRALAAMLDSSVLNVFLSDSVQ